MSLTPYQTKDKKGKPRISLMASTKSEQNRELTFGVIKMELKKMSSRLQLFKSFFQKMKIKTQRKDDAAEKSGHENQSVVDGPID